VRLLNVPGVFRPHSDSWLLASHLMAESVPHGGAILDLCSGSGLLAVLAARAHTAEVVAVDISRRAVLATRINARLNDARVQSVRGDLFMPVRGRQFDLIISNPPYLPTEDGAPGPHNRARAWEAGRSGRLFLDRICREGPTHLRCGGVLLLVHSSVCGELQTLNLLGAVGLQPSVVGRKRGPLGPRLQARASWLRSRALVSDDGSEELLVIRAVRR
jgi:release factor glutamine methyltransferase